MSYRTLEIDDRLVGLWSGRVARPATDADTLALNDKLLGDERIDLSLLPID